MDSTTTTHYYDFGSFRLDVSNRLLTRNGDHIPLTQKSFEILCFLIRNRNRILRKHEILEEVWNENFVEEANLAQHIYMVRKALKDNRGTAGYIETLPKFGYRFTAEVNESFADLCPNEPPIAFASLSVPAGATPALAATGRPASGTRYGRTPRSAYALLLPGSVAALAAILLTVLGFSYFYPGGKEDAISVTSISILPFRQIGGDRDEKLSLGLADTLISRLGSQGQFTVSPTLAITNFAGSSDSPGDIGQELGVDAVMTGTIQRDKNRVRVNVQMISVERKVPIWTDKFDVEFSDIFSLQDKVSTELAAKLAERFGKAGDDRKPAKVNPQALQAFEKGVYFWKKRTGENLKAAIGHFEDSARLDPEFAKASALLADSYSLAASYGLGWIDPEEAISKAKKAAERSLALDASTSQAYSALAVVAQYEKDADRAAMLLKKAISLDPENAVAHLRLAWVHALDENLDEAISEMKLARRADPDSQVIALNLARLLRLNRQTDEALKVGRKAVDLDPGMMWTRVILAEIYEQKGMFDESIEELRAVPKSAPEEKTARILMSRVLAKKGNKKEARKILKDVTDKETSGAPSYEVASVLAQLGDEQQAFRELRRSDEDSLIQFLHIKYDYNLDPLRGNPAYPGIVSQSRLKFISSYDKNS